MNLCTVAHYEDVRKFPCAGLLLPYYEAQHCLLDGPCLVGPCVGPELHRLAHRSFLVPVEGEVAWNGLLDVAKVLPGCEARPAVLSEIDGTAAVPSAS